MGKHREKPQNPPAGTPPQALVAALRGQIERLESSRWPRDEQPVSTGCETLDRLLPERGLRRGTLVEWLAAGSGSGAETLALGVAGRACGDGGALVVLDDRRQFYPPAAARLGIELERMIVVQAQSEADRAWALDQALRCPAVAAVLAWPARLDDRAFRRMQLAAEQGGALGLLLRPETARREPSWADVRFEVEPAAAGDRHHLPRSGQFPGSPLSGSATSEQGRRLRIEVLRCRGGTSGGSLFVEIDDATNTVSVASPLARRARDARAAGA